MPRIVYYHPRLRLADGGVVRAILDWCAVLARRGNVITLITCDATDLPPEWLAAGALQPKVVVIGPLGPMGRLSAAARDIVAAELCQAHVVHLHEVWFFSCVQIARLCRSSGVPYVFTLHGMLDDWSIAQKHLKKRIFLALFTRSMLNRAARIHCTAAAEVDQSQKWHDNPRIAILPYLFDLEPFKALPGPAAARERFHQARSEQTKVLFLSRLHPKKGIEILLTSLALLKNQGKPIVAMIAGTGTSEYRAQLERQSAELGLRDSVVFVGMVSGVEKLSLYQAADLFVLPTSQENFGLVLIESLACRTPIVTTRGVDIWQELEQAGGRVVETSPQAIAAAISDLAADPPLMKSIGERGREWVFSHLDAERVAGAYEGMFEAITQRSPPTA